MKAYLVILRFALNSHVPDTVFFDSELANKYAKENNGYVITVEVDYLSFEQLVLSKIREFLNA